MKDKIRILISKPGLDGHDKGAKIIALALKNAGFKVFYSGLHQSINQIINKAKIYSINVIGLSIMTGNHVAISKECIKKLKKNNMSDVMILVGGVIPKKDISKLINIGVKAVFPNGSSPTSVTESIKNLF